MTRYVVVPIVEGKGEVEAVPILIQRWLAFRRYQNVEVHVDGPVRAPGRGAITVPHNDQDELGIEYYIGHASRRRPDAILVVLDADEDCPATLGAELLARARRVVPDGFPISVVVANREYEAWFLAALASLKFRRAINRDESSPEIRPLPARVDIEAIADCKKRVAEWILGTRYKETTHQRSLTEILPFTPAVIRRSRSFRKLLKDLDRLLKEARRRRSASRPDRPV
jgi:hypothetical protein